MARTTLVTRFLALSLIPISIAKLLVRAFHAHLDQRTPLIVSVWTIAGNLVLNLVLIQTSLQEAGLALASAIAAAAGCGWYLRLLARRGTGPIVEWRGLIRPIAAAAVMGVAVESLLWLWPQPPERGSGMAVLRLGAAVALGGICYLGIAGTGFLRRERATPSEPQGS